MTDVHALRDHARKIERLVKSAASLPDSDDKDHWRVDLGGLLQALALQIGVDDGLSALPADDVATVIHLAALGWIAPSFGILTDHLRRLSSILDKLTDD